MQEQGRTQDEYVKNILIQPICLPPYGPVDPRMINNGSISQFWYKDGMPLVPFEDMDCEVEFAEKIQVPIATDAEVRETGCNLALSFDALPVNYRAVG